MSLSCKGCFCALPAIEGRCVALWCRQCLESGKTPTEQAEIQALGDHVFIAERSQPIDRVDPDHTAHGT